MSNSSNKWVIDTAGNGNKCLKLYNNNEQMLLQSAPYSNDRDLSALLIGLIGSKLPARVEDWTMPATEK